MKLEWNPGLVLGVPAMDAEHKQLIEAMQKVAELDGVRAGKAQVDGALLRLVRLTKQHFADEERHMEQIDFPDRKRHALIHADMLKKIAEHYAVFQAGDGRVAPAFFAFLTHWLGAHIQGIDRKYAQHPAPVR